MRLPENGLNFPPEPNEEAFGLLYQMVKIWSRREQSVEPKTVANIKKWSQTLLYPLTFIIL